MAVFRGRLMAVVVDGATVCVTGWDFDENANKEEVTDSCSPGEGNEYEESIPETTGSFTGFIKDTQNLHADPPDIIRGNTLRAKFYLRKNTSYYYEGDIFIDNYRPKGEIKGMFTFEVGWTLIGDWVQRPIYA